MRAGNGADAIESVRDVGHPVAQRLVHRVLQRARAGLNGDDLGAQHLHAEYVGLLPLDVDRAHVDDAFEAEARAGRRGRDAMLAGARLGDDARLAHAAGEQDLAQHIVDLVRAGMVELVALEVDLRAAEMLGHPLGEIERARPPDIMLQEIVELGLEARVRFGVLVGLLQREDQRHQRFGDEAAAEHAEMAALVGAVAERVGFFDLHALPYLLILTLEGGDRRVDEGLDFPRILDAGRAFDAGRHIDAARAGKGYGLADIARVKPPDSSQGLRGRKSEASRQSKATPLPPGSTAPFGGLASISRASLLPS